MTDSGPVLLTTGLMPLDLGAFGSGYDTTNPFAVDTLSIMAYNDGFTTADEPSLKASITYQSISVVSTPEPSSLVLTLIAVRRGTGGPAGAPAADPVDLTSPDRGLMLSGR